MREEPISNQNDSLCDIITKANYMNCIMESLEKSKRISVRTPEGKKLLVSVTNQQFRNPPVPGDYVKIGFFNNSKTGGIINPHLLSKESNEPNDTLLNKIEF